MSDSFPQAAPVSDAVRDHELVLSHADGRHFRVGVYGARDFAKVVFYSHGFPACRLEASIAHKVAREMGITVVALDRPGFGGSQWYRGRRFEDWALDVERAADHLGVSSFGVLGVSGGTPTAIAAAGLLPERVTKLVVVSGVAPMHDEGALSGMNWANRGLLRVGQVCPLVGEYAIGTLAAAWRLIPGVAMLWFASLLPKADISIVSRPEVGVMLARNIKESLRPGVRGVMTEFSLLISDWRGLLPKVTVPTSIWHGDADTYVPISMAQILHKGINGSSFHQVEGGGHFMIVDRLRDVLQVF